MILFALLLSLAFSDDRLALSGRAFSDMYVPLHRDSTTKAFEQLSTSVWLQADSKLSDSLSARAIGQGDGFEGNNSALTSDSASTHLQTNIREAYLDYSNDQTQVRAGKLIIPWGKSDAINPTDFLTARDYTFLNPDSEVGRIGGVSVLASEALVPKLTITFVWTPIFPRSKNLIPSNLVPLGTTVASSDTPPVTFDNSEFATKASYNGDMWDASLSFFRGWDHLPLLSEINHQIIALTAFVNLAQTFHKIRALGADGSWTLDKWIVRGETAYTWTENDDASNMLVTPSHWDCVLGVERPLGKKWRGQLQGVFRYFPTFSPIDHVGGPDFVAIQVNQQIARANALLEQYQDRSRTSATARLSYTDEDWEAELFFLKNITNGGDYLLRPKITYAVFESLKASAGIEYYDGPADRPFGALAPYSSYFLEARYIF